MGKSPGKWIKTVLFGKKLSKSKPSRNASTYKRASAETIADEGNSPVILSPHQLTENGAVNVELEKGTSGTLSNTTASVTGSQGLESHSCSVPVSDDEMKKQVEAATKSQAAFRGYLVMFLAVRYHYFSDQEDVLEFYANCTHLLFEDCSIFKARRAFWALKGIIRLQALMRGHLVRREAVATLCCIHGIIKLQAMARGRIVRLSDTTAKACKKYNMEELQVDTGVKSIIWSEKLATNLYTHKLLLSMPTAIPLSLQYDRDEPNSSWNWLDRWSCSRICAPPTRPRKFSIVKPLRKLDSSQHVENDNGKSKRNIRRAENASKWDNGVFAALEMDKTKRNMKKGSKASNQQKELAQEQAQTELERVKRSLRKISGSATTASDKPETVIEKPQQKPNATTASQLEIVIDAEKAVNAVAVANGVEAPPKATTNDSINVPHDDLPVVEFHSSENDKEMENKRLLLQDDLNSKVDSNIKENHKIRNRRSLPAKQEFNENASLNTRPCLPSYMAATESAKAKLRASGMPKLVEDAAELNQIRRYSLPASMNGKLASLSPRIHQPNGKASNKANKSLMSSRDDKVLQPGWKR